MFELIKKTYWLKIWNNIYTYKQASLAESIDYLYIRQKDFKWAEYLAELFGKDLSSENNKEFISDLLELDEIKTLKTIESTRHKHFFGTWSKWKQDTIPYNAYIVHLCDKLNVSPKNLLEDYTAEAINYLQWWVTYIANEQTEEGRQKNKQIESAKKSVMSDEQMEAILKARKARDNIN